MVGNGYTVYAYDPRVAAWAAAARNAASRLDTSVRRHGSTWFVGVDALPNTADGAIDGVPLAGPWDARALHWHPAQLSIVYSGYPRQDADETDAAHRFRLQRDAAHMDGLLPEGPDKRRHLREPHAFILGITLNACRASPLVVWPGSHLIMQSAFIGAFDGIAPEHRGDVDVTDIYQAARRRVFETCTRVCVPVGVGQSVLLHRHLIHGVAPWEGPDLTEGRMIAYFRPQLVNIADWI